MEHSAVFPAKWRKTHLHMNSRNSQTTRVYLIYTHLHINARVSQCILSRRCACIDVRVCAASTHSRVNIEPSGWKGRAVRGGGGCAALQLYIYHSRIAHCARNRNGMPIGRKNAISAPSNTWIILDARPRESEKKDASNGATWRLHRWQWFCAEW